jgi:cob(I)alamin adenosyltransferase
LTFCLLIADFWPYYSTMLEKGLVQVYTGDGKGKTTAAFGLALRAAGQNNKVLIYQFLKPPSLDIGERFALQLGAVRIRVEALDVAWDMAKSLDDKDGVAKMRSAIGDALEKIAQTAEKRFYDVLILDEIVFCLAKGLAKLEDIKSIIDRKDPGVEIVMTGRGATKELLDLADLATEMKNLKHPFDRGIGARRGIEY